MLTKFFALQMAGEKDGWIARSIPGTEATAGAMTDPGESLTRMPDMEGGSKARYSYNPV
jgi:hypothetical protein